VKSLIDEHHRILKILPVEHMPAAVLWPGPDCIYQEPLELVLEYLGLSMRRNQVVNANIDGEEEGVRRALIPGHLLNAKHWFDKYTSR
jgi:hypothetical protein